MPTPSSESAATTPSPRPFASLAHAQYASLVTVRKSGQPVATPVWFAERDGTIYIHASGGKVTRIRHTTRVTLAPCTLGGKVIGPAVGGNARILTDPRGIAVAAAALDRKYRLVRRAYYFALDALRALRRRPAPTVDGLVFIAIVPVTRHVPRGSAGAAAARTGLAKATSSATIRSVVE